MKIYDPAFLIYPALFFGGQLIVVFTAKRGLGTFIAGEILYILFWFVIYIVLCIAVSFDALTSLNYLGYCIGGCV